MDGGGKEGDRRGAVASGKRILYQSNNQSRNKASARVINQTSEASQHASPAATNHSTWSRIRNQHGRRLQLRLCVYGIPCILGLASYAKLV